MCKKATGEDGSIPPLDDSESVIVFSPDYLRDVNLLIEEYMKTDEGKITLSNYMVRMWWKRRCIENRSLMDELTCMDACLNFVKNLA